MEGTHPPVLHRHRPLWQRLIVLAILTGGSVLLALVGLALTVGILFQQPWFQQWFFERSLAHQLARVQEPSAEPRIPYPGPDPLAAELETAAQLFHPATIWTAHLRFTGEEWDAIQPTRVPRLPGWIQRGGAPLLRNPKAPRAGLAGVLGFAQPWSKGRFEFGGVELTNVAVRFKGNGTFVEALETYQRPFKLDFDRHVPGRRFAGQVEFNLHNLVADRSFLSDTLAYEFFREAGVPASRTTFARLFLSLDGRWERRLLGLYLVVEDPDDAWLAGVLGTGGGALFKPVTLELFRDLGDDWKPYEEIYDPKNEVTEPQRRRLIELARLVTHADEADFAGRIGEWIDLDAFARFVACEALLSNYDSLFDNGQNFLLWLDPRTNRFGFGPWDLDHSWGEFGWIGTSEQRERVSLWHPWVGENRFLERMFAVEDFRQRYRRELRRLVDTLFVPDRLDRRIDELAAVVRPAVAEQSADRLRLFEHAVGAPASDETSSAQGARRRPSREGHQLKRFIAARAAEARDQLDGKSEGVIVRRGSH